MGELIAIKRDSYGHKHQHPYVPIGMDDYYAINVFICDAKTDEPIIVFKTVPHSYSIQYSNTLFPLYEHSMFSCNDLQYARIKKFVERHLESHDVAYCGGWAVNINYKGKGLSDELKDIYTAVNYHLNRERNIGVMTGIGLIEVGTHLFFEKYLGAKDLIDEPVRLTTIEHMMSHLMYADMKTIPKSMIESADKYKFLWEAREVYSASKQKKKQTA